MEMRAQFGERHDRIYRLAVLEDMKVVGGKINNARAVKASNVSLPYVPLVWYRPIERWSPRGNLIKLERDVALKGRQGLPYAISGDAAANWEELLGKRHHDFPLAIEIRSPLH
jgi:hypothetical protein